MHALPRPVCCRTCVASALCRAAGCPAAPPSCRAGSGSAARRLRQAGVWSCALCCLPCCRPCVTVSRHGLPLTAQPCYIDDNAVPSIPPALPPPLPHWRLPPCHRSTLTCWSASAGSQSPAKHRLRARASGSSRRDALQLSCWAAMAARLAGSWLLDGTKASLGDACRDQQGRSGVRCSRRPRGVRYRRCTGRRRAQGCSALPAPLTELQGLSAATTSCGGAPGCRPRAGVRVSSLCCARGYVDRPL